MHVAVIGGGVAGLGVALALARRGDDVTVIERDATPMPESADAAFDWDRRGAPQVRHSHAFLARLHGLLSADYPDVLQSLLDEGATEVRFGDVLPPDMVGFVAEAADAELVMLACRRTTFEWVIRRAALAEGRVTFRTGVAANGFVTSALDQLPGGGSRPIVTGVSLVDGSSIAADLVVVAAGRRSLAPEWLAAIGAAPVAETAEDTGIVYFSRFYRLLDGAEYPLTGGLIGGDLGYVKYGVFVGDNRTFSITLAVSTDDGDLRRVLADPAVFEAAASALTVTQPWLDGRAEAITGVHVMAGLLNRWRDYVVDGEAVALGVVPVGDAILCTNPLYGRGCTTAFWGAHLLAQALDEHPGDPDGAARAYDSAVRAQIRPWYAASVEQDGEARRVAVALLSGSDPDADAEDPRTFVRGLLRDGLVPATRRDPVVLRAFMRVLNMLSAPDALLTDPDVGARIFAVWEGRADRAPEPSLGPRRRDDFVALLPAS